MRTANQIEREYSVNIFSLCIASPGKFQGQPRWAPYYYDLFIDENVDGQSWFTVTQDDIKEFPELRGTRTITMAQDDQGFVYAVAE